MSPFTSSILTVPSGLRANTLIFLRLLNSSSSSAALSSAFSFVGTISYEPSGETTCHLSLSSLLTFALYTLPISYSLSCSTFSDCLFALVNLYGIGCVGVSGVGAVSFFSSSGSLATASLSEAISSASLKYFSKPSLVDNSS